MPNLPEPHLWPLLAKSHGRSQTLSEWEQSLGASGCKSTPLTLQKGERAKFIRCPQTGIPLEIHETYDGTYSALPPAGSELDTRIDGLTLDDLRLYEIDWASLLSVLQHELHLVGTARPLSYRPPLWDLGTFSGAPVYFFIASSIEDVASILPFARSNTGCRLLLPAATDKIYAELSKLDVSFHVLDSIPSLSGLLSVSQNQSRFRIHEQHGGWKIVFDGKEASISNLKGLALVAYLLKNPPSAPMHILELESRILPTPTFTVKPDEDIAEDFESTGLSISERLKEFNLNMDNAESDAALRSILPGLRAKLSDPDIDDQGRALAEKTIAEIESFLNSGGPKHADQSKKAYERVRQQFIRLMKKLREPLKKTGKPSPVLTAFADHLDDHLLQPSSRFSRNRQSRVKTGVAQTLTYEPPPGIVWTD